MRRAFVVQLIRDESDDRCEGRIEHVDSGRSKHFRSLSEAVYFVRRIESELGYARQDSSETTLNEETRDGGQN